MFEAGKDYHFRMLENGGEATFVARVEEVHGTLIRISSQFDKERIVNTASQLFVSAEPYERDPQAEARFEKLMKGMTEL
jgi:hypothetical protein